MNWSIVMSNPLSTKQDEIGEQNDDDEEEEEEEDNGDTLLHFNLENGLLLRLGVVEVAEEDRGAKGERVHVLRAGGKDLARSAQGSALGLGLGGRFDHGDAHEAEQLLAVLVVLGGDVDGAFLQLAHGLLVAGLGGLVETLLGLLLLGRSLLQF